MTLLHGGICQKHTKVTDMTKDLEQTMRNVYNGLPKEELVNHCIELDRRIEFLEFRIACLDASDRLHETAKAIEKEIKGENNE